METVLTSALTGGEWSASRPGHFTPGTRRIGGWMGLWAGLDAGRREKFMSLLLPRIEPRSSIPVPKNTGMYF